MPHGRATAPPPGSPYFHVLVRRSLFRDARAFNLTEAELFERFVEPWRHGQRVLLEGRAWDPTASRLTIYEGPRLSTQQRSLGQGWLNAVRFGENVTEEMLNRWWAKDDANRSEGPGHYGSAPGHRHPTLWGHVHRVPVWLATTADLITVAGFLAAGAKLVGAW